LGRGPRARIPRRIPSPRLFFPPFLRSSVVKKRVCSCIGAARQTGERKHQGVPLGGCNTLSNHGSLRDNGGTEEEVGKRAPGPNSPSNSFPSSPLRFSVPPWLENVLELYRSCLANRRTKAPWGAFERLQHASEPRVASRQRRNGASGWEEGPRARIPRRIPSSRLFFPPFLRSSVVKKRVCSGVRAVLKPCQYPSLIDRLTSFLYSSLYTNPRLRSDSRRSSGKGVLRQKMPRTSLSSFCVPSLSFVSHTM